MQGYSRKLVLRQLLKAAVNWMQAGLPLRTLKIVIFSRHQNDKTLEPLFQLFEEFKADNESKNLVEEPSEEDVVHLYDIYLSHCNSDHSTALQVKTFLQEKEDLKVFDDIQDLNENESWQDDIYNTMSRCSRVITLLSPGYLASQSCIEQYNMGLCISRKQHREVLAPFYISSVENLPTYMGLMQYIDCRPQDDLKLKEASHSIKRWLEDNHIETVSQEQAAMTEKPLESMGYDIFISYCHNNKDIAYQVLECLNKCDPNIKVFIDTAGLKTGASWQQSLFHAIDQSGVMVALLSEDYFKSKVCREEFSLASALHFDDAKDFKLVTVLVENVKKYPVWCCKPRPVDCISKDAESMSDRFSSIATGIINSFKGFDELEERLAILNEDRVSIDECMQRYRKTQFAIRKCLVSEPLSTDLQVSPVAEPQDASQSGSASSVVALSFAEEDVSAALTMKQLLIEGCPNLEISEPRGTNATSRLKALDDAEVIVIMLSPAYLNSKELVDELNIALYRHRSSPHQVMYPIQLSPLPTKPTYVRLLPCDFSAMDYSWMTTAHDTGNLDPGRIEHLAMSNDISNGVALCLLEASDLIVNRLTGTGSQVEHTQVIINSLEVQKSWNEVREQVVKMKGLHQLKLSFDVEVTSDDGELAVHGNDESGETDGKNNLGTHSSHAEKAKKVPVEQDESGHGSNPPQQDNQSPKSVDKVVEDAPDQSQEDQVEYDLQNDTCENDEQRTGSNDNNYLSGKDKRKAKSCLIL